MTETGSRSMGYQPTYPSPGSNPDSDPSSNPSSSSSSNPSSSSSSSSGSNTDSDSSSSSGSNPDSHPSSSSGSNHPDSNPSSSSGSNHPDPNQSSSSGDAGTTSNGTGQVVFSLNPQEEKKSDYFEELNFGIVISSQKGDEQGEYTNNNAADEYGRFTPEATMALIKKALQEDDTVPPLFSSEGNEERGNRTIAAESKYKKMEENPFNPNDVVGNSKPTEIRNPGESLLSYSSSYLVGGYSATAVNGFGHEAPQPPVM